MFLQLWPFEASAEGRARGLLSQAAIPHGHNYTCSSLSHREVKRGRRLQLLVGEVDRELAEWQNSEGCHQRR